MSEMSDVWKVHGGEMSRKCPKYDIIVTGCSRYFECKKCMGKKQVLPVEKKKKIKPVKKTKKQKKRSKCAGKK